MTVNKCELTNDNVALWMKVVVTVLTDFRACAESSSDVVVSSPN